MGGGEEGGEEKGLCGRALCWREGKQEAWRSMSMERPPCSEEGVEFKKNRSQPQSSSGRSATLGNGTVLKSAFLFCDTLSGMRGWKGHLGSAGSRQRAHPGRQAWGKGRRELEPWV